MAFSDSGAAGRVVAIGELLVDFVPQQVGCPLADVRRFERVMGGAPANVACAVARLGGAAALVSQVGQDAFGTYVVDELGRAGVDTRWVYCTSRANTGLSFVSLSATGEREFSFFRNPSADLLLSEEQVVPEMFEGCSVLHFCSVDLVDWPVKEAHRRAVELAGDGGALVSFDPNVRLALWDAPDDCRRAISEFLPLADIVKLSDDELEFVTGCADEERAARSFLSSGCSLLVVTHGAQGSTTYTRRARASVPAVRVPVSDTTGAGDAFIGALLYQLARDGVGRERLHALDTRRLAGYLGFSTGYASLTVRHAGAYMASAGDFARAFPEMRP